MSWRQLQWISSVDMGGFESTGHMTLPILLRLDSERVALFWSTRDRDNRSYILGADAVFDSRSLEINWSSVYVALSPGEEGTFDCDGVSCSDVRLDQSGNLEIFYFGWQRLPSFHWLNGIGVARGAFGSPLSRISAGPLLGRDVLDQFSVAYPFISRFSESELFYSTYTRFADPRTTSSFRYAVKRAEIQLDSGRVENRIEVDIEEVEGASAYSRPTIFSDGKNDILLCSVRGTHYEIRGWIRKSTRWVRAPHLDGNSLRGPMSQDSTCYQFPFVAGTNCFILYNGDRYGATGFGLAKLDA